MDIEPRIIEIERLGIYGEGVGTLEDGRVVFVEDALPGEMAHLVLTEVKQTYARAKVLKYVKTSSLRVEPICPVFSQCGGCQCMHLDYEEQLEVKRQKVVDALERVGKIFDIDVLPCIRAPNELHYRNKIQLPVLNGVMGLYGSRSHDLVPIEKCYIHCALGEKAFGKIKEILRFGYFNIKHVLIKTALRTEQVLVVLVGKSVEDWRELGEKILGSLPEIKGVVQNVNPKDHNTILGDRFFLLAGQSFIEENLCGLRFKVSAASFFQVNPLQAEVLYRKAIDWCDLKGSETVLDAYCGIGTLSLLLAQKAQKVMGIEFSHQAILDARDNAQTNGITNVDFQCIEAEKALLPKIDVAVMNPPRKGCCKMFLEQLLIAKPEKIVYISCDPATLARDLAILCKNGYDVCKVQPVDMFPQTMHVETIVQLKRKYI